MICSEAKDEVENQRTLNSERRDKMFICGETGVQLKAELIGETTYFKLYNVFGSDGKFLYRTTESKQLKTHKDNVAIIFSYDILVTAEEKKTECGFTRKRKKMKLGKNIERA